MYRSVVGRKGLYWSRKSSPKPAASSEGKPHNHGVHFGCSKQRCSNLTVSEAANNDACYLQNVIYTILPFRHLPPGLLPTHLCLLLSLMWLFFLECICHFNHISLLLHKNGHWIFLLSWNRRPRHLMQLKAAPQIFENSHPLPLAAFCMQLCFQELQSQETEGKMIVVVWGKERGLFFL